MQTVQKYLREYRNELKGIAILWVVFFHAHLDLENGLLYEIQKVGYGGVDIFFFLSGFGLYRSLSKNDHLGSYIKRRAFRLLPSFVPFVALWSLTFAYRFSKGLVSFVSMVSGNLTMIGFFVNDLLMINWYLSGMVVSLLLAPYFYACLKPGKGYWARVGLVMAVCLIAGFAFIRNDEYMAISRLPVFVLGMVFSRPYEPETRQSKKGVMALLAMGLLAGYVVLQMCYAYYPHLLLAFAMYWHPYIIITPGLCVLMAWLCSLLPQKARRSLAFLGKASFEIFLFNGWMEIFAKRWVGADTPQEWLVLSIVFMVFGLIYHVIVSKIVKKVVDKRMARVIK